MSCFTKKEFYNAKFPKLSSRAKELKSAEGGASVMSEVMEKLLAEGRRSQLIELVKEGLLQIDIAARKAGMSVEEFKKLM